MRTIKALLVSLALLTCAIPALAVTPAPVQTCQKANGGTSAQMYTVTIAGSGGTTGCTSNFTAGNALMIAYNQQSGSSDRTTSNISATGATITFRKAISVQNSVFAPPGYFTGILYACPSDITSPTSSIAITVDMGASMAGITSIFVQEVTNIQSTSCLDKTAIGSTCCDAPQYGTAATGTLSNASEYALAATMSESGTGITIAAGSGGACASSCLTPMSWAIPSQGQDNESASAEAIEYLAVTATTNGIASFNQSPVGLSQNIVVATFIAGASAVQRVRHRSWVW